MHPMPEFGSFTLLLALALSVYTLVMGGVSLRRTVELRKRNSAGSPTTNPNSRSGSTTSVPSSIPKGTTQSAFSGASIPGTAGIALSIPT